MHKRPYNKKIQQNNQTNILTVAPVHLVRVFKISGSLGFKGGHNFLNETRINRRELYFRDSSKALTIFWSILFFISRNFCAASVLLKALR